MKINGNEYKVAIQDVNGQNVEVEVNGIAYSVELDQPARTERPKPVIARPSAPAATTVAPSASQQNDVHAEGACNPEMVARIEEMSIHEEETPDTDPRWKDLEKLKSTIKE